MRFLSGIKEKYCIFSIKANNGFKGRISNKKRFAAGYNRHFLTVHRQLNYKFLFLRSLFFAFLVGLQKSFFIGCKNCNFLMCSESTVFSTSSRLPLGYKPSLLSRRFLAASSRLRHGFVTASSGQKSVSRWGCICCVIGAISD